MSSSILSLNVRRFEKNDLPGILKIEDSSFGRQAWPRELFEDYADRCGQQFLVARVGRSMAGYSIACLTRHGAELVSIAVLPRYRHRGVATELLRATLRKARASGAAALWLMVRSGNRAAISFYKKHGFVRTSTVRGYYEDGADAWRMKLTLGQARQ